MSTVYVFDDKLTPASSSLIQIIEVDQRGVRLDIRANGAIGTLYGAKMKVPAPPVPVGFWVDDTGRTFAPTGLQYLRPSASLSVDVTLLPLPSPAPVAGGGGPGGPGGPGGGGRHGPHGSGGPGGPTSGAGSPADDDDSAPTELAIRRGARWRLSAPITVSGNSVAGMLTLSTVAKSAQWTEEETRGVATLISSIAAARMLEDPGEDFLKRLRRWESWLRELGVVVSDESSGSGSSGLSYGLPVMEDTDAQMHRPAEADYENQRYYETEG